MRNTSTLLLAAFGVALLALPSTADAQRRRRADGPDPVAAWVTIATTGGTCLDLHAADHGPQGARVVFRPCDGAPSQLWRFERGTLVSAMGGCLDLRADDLGQQGARLHTWSCHGAPSQQWLARADGSITSGAGGCLDVDGGAVSRDGARAIRWACHGGENQRFRVLSSAPRPQRADAGPRALDDAAFDALIARVRAASFSADRVATVADAARGHRFTGAQVATIVSEMSFSAERIQALELLAPRLVDARDSALIIDSMSFSSERARAREILAAHTR
jgi:hypothetical protein